jgi:hypothetical protein
MGSLVAPPDCRGEPGAVGLIQLQCAGLPLSRMRDACSLLLIRPAALLLAPVPAGARWPSCVQRVRLTSACGDLH